MDEILLHLPMGATLCGCCFKTCPLCAILFHPVFEVFYCLVQPQHASQFALFLARKMFDGMLERDLVCWYSFMDGYARCGEIELALELLDECPRGMLFHGLCLLTGSPKVVSSSLDQMEIRNAVTWMAGYELNGNV
ncbi:pentatricopeptide repeat-containing protein At3g29230-like [Actinidia eriantha]|uniref:pentatricopeptide repeat-containing protein At3g29230-like n=1 Tax=Actinidia eriantha TaxID=165200 RepID=UPI00258E6308|nr:pentatricopeptide repeat-containing protein At3g29230-like [Actinidia eriantha]